MDSGTPALWPLWINGAEVFTAKQRAVRSPYDHQLAGTVCEADTNSIVVAVEAADRARPVMRSLSRRERADILRAAAVRLRTQRDQFAATITAESAKPIRESLTEVDRGIATLEFSADEALRLVGEIVPMDAAPTGKGYLALPFVNRSA